MAETSTSGRRVRGTAVAVAAFAVVGGSLFPARAGAVEPSADLSVTVGHAPAAGMTATDLTFTIAANNAGPDAAQDVVLALSFDYPLEFRSASAGCAPSSGERNSVLCEAGTVPAGGSATATVVVRPFASGLYTVPAAAASTTADPDRGDLAAEDNVIVRRGPSQGERYIRGVFPLIFDRAPDSATVAFYAERFKAAFERYPQDLASVPFSLIQSNEYRRIRIREAYQRILARPASAQDLTYWVGRAASGLSYEAIERRLITSGEFAAKHDGGDPTSATVGAYQAVLRRSPTQAEVTAAVRRYAEGATFASVVLGIQRSTEGYDVIIGQRHQQALGHGPSPLSRYVWQAKLRRGVSPERLFAELLVSNEILRQYPRTEDDYGPYPAGRELRHFDFTT